MKAKDYLKKLKKLETLISQKLEELNTLRYSAIRTTVNTEQERVKTSGGSDRLGNTVSRIVDYDSEINAEIDEFIKIKHQIINQIQGMDNVNHIQLLYKKYVQFKSFDIIAEEMNYTYQYTIELHGSALKVFEETYLNLLNSYD